MRRECSIPGNRDWRLINWKTHGMLRGCIGKWANRLTELGVEASQGAAGRCQSTSPTPTAARGSLRDRLAGLSYKDTTVAQWRRHQNRTAPCVDSRRERYSGSQLGVFGAAFRAI